MGQNIMYHGELALIILQATQTSALKSATLCGCQAEQAVKLRKYQQTQQIQALPFGCRLDGALVRLDPLSCALSAA